MSLEQEHEQLADAIREKAKAELRLLEQKEALRDAERRVAAARKAMAEKKKEDEIIET